MITILFSHERSGSHLLAELLASFGGIVSIEEVCNANHVPAARGESFHGFRRDWWLSHPDTATDPSFEKSVKLGEAFFAHLSTLWEKNNLVVDIKYGHLHNFEGYWAPLFRRPLLFFLCDTIPMNIIHLYRRNVVEAVVSAHVAEIRQVWHSYGSEAAEAMGQRYTMDVPTVVEDALLLREQTRWIREKWLRQEGSFNVEYEQLVSALQDEPSWLDDLASFVGGVRTGRFTPSIRKLGRPLRDSIENFEALTKACQEAGLGEFI
jgi:LPS sulfotransferase NodH